MPFLLVRARRITRSSEYRRVYSGVKLVGRYALLFYREAGAVDTRVGLTVSGKVGKACERNLFKRRLKEALMVELDASDPRAELVFVATRRIREAGLDQIKKDLRALIARVK